MVGVNFKKLLAKVVNLIFKYFLSSYFVECGWRCSKEFGKIWECEQSSGARDDISTVRGATANTNSEQGVNEFWHQGGVIKQLVELSFEITEGDMSIEQKHFQIKKASRRI